MNLRELANHEIIGIDLDNTLIDNARSRALQRFIVMNPTKQFHIITFRSHGLEKDIPIDIGISIDQTGVPLRMSHFAGVHNIPNHLYEQRLMFSDAYWGWKAKKCCEIGCTVLIDDMAEFLREHCLLHGIICLNPNES